MEWGAGALPPSAGGGSRHGLAIAVARGGPPVRLQARRGAMARGCSAMGGKPFLPCTFSLNLKLAPSGDRGFPFPSVFTPRGEGSGDLPFGRR